MVGNDDAGTLDRPAVDPRAAADHGEKERRSMVAEPAAPEHPGRDRKGDRDWQRDREERKPCVDSVDRIRELPCAAR
jgi:hypothetical protein